MPPSDNDGSGGCLTGPEGYRVREKKKNAPVYLPTRVRVVVSCLKSASLSVCIFHNSLAGIFRREDPSRDKEILQSLVSFCFSPLPSPPPLPPPSFSLSSTDRRRGGYKQKPLNCFPFVEVLHISPPAFDGPTFDRLALRRSNSIMPLLRNKEEEIYRRHTGARECGHVCAQRNTSK